MHVGLKKNNSQILILLSRFINSPVDFPGFQTTDTGNVHAHQSSNWPVIPFKVSKPRPRITSNRNKYARLWGLTYIHTCRSYVHTPRELDRQVVKSPTGTFIVLHALADSSDFGLLGEQSSPKREMPCQGRRWTALQNLTPLAFLGKEIRNRTNKQTNQITNHNRYIHTLPINQHVWIINLIGPYQPTLRRTVPGQASSSAQSPVALLRFPWTESVLVLWDKPSSDDNTSRHPSLHTQ